MADLDEKLLPCPHCGEYLMEHSDHHGSWWAHRNEPADCAHGVTQLFDSEDIKRWNRRALPSPVTPAIDVVEALADIEGMAENIRLVLVDQLTEPMRSAFWKGVAIRNRAQAALSALAPAQGEREGGAK